MGLKEEMTPERKRRILLASFNALVFCIILLAGLAFWFLYGQSGSESYTYTISKKAGSGIISLSDFTSYSSGYSSGSDTLWLQKGDTMVVEVEVTGHEAGSLRLYISKGWFGNLREKPPLDEKFEGVEKRQLSFKAPHWGSYTVRSSVWPDPDGRAELSYTARWYVK